MKKLIVFLFIAFLFNNLLVLGQKQKVDFLEADSLVSSSAFNIERVNEFGKKQTMYISRGDLKNFSKFNIWENSNGYKMVISGDVNKFLQDGVLVNNVILTVKSCRSEKFWKINVPKNSKIFVKEKEIVIFSEQNTTFWKPKKLNKKENSSDT